MSRPIDSWRSIQYQGLIIPLGRDELYARRKWPVEPRVFVDIHLTLQWFAHRTATMMFEPPLGDALSAITIFADDRDHGLENTNESNAVDVIGREPDGKFNDIQPTHAKVQVIQVKHGMKGLEVTAVRPVQRLDVAGPIIRLLKVSLYQEVGRMRVELGGP